MLKAKLTKKSNRSYEDIHYSCTVRFLDDSEPLTVTYQKESKGQWLLDHVCKELNLVEKDYFGLRYVDSDKQRHWLDPIKSVHRQMKNVSPTVLCFRVKFYPSDPMKLKEEITRYLIFLQLRRDLHHGRLLCSPNDANEMAAHIVQSEVGDFDPQDHEPGYVAKFKMLPKQTQKQEEKIAELHGKIQGQVPADAETNFLQKTCTLETYGVDPHPVKDQKGNQMYLGVTHLGIVTFQGNKRTHLFKWEQINKIAFEGKMFIVHVTISEGEDNSLLLKNLTFKKSKSKKKHACGFKCATFSACKHLWKCAIEQQYFFTLNSSVEAKKVTSGGSFFTRGSKFRFSGRCQKEVCSDSANITRDEPSFNRSTSNPQFVRSFSNSRSMSMPSRLRDQSALSDGAKDKNHVLTMDSLLITSTPLEDHIEPTIPEEPIIELGDSPYRPMSSPTSESLPPIPMDEVISNGASSIVPNNKAVTLPRTQKALPQEPCDLDLQISELQKELERCRKTAEAEESLKAAGVDVRSGTMSGLRDADDAKRDSGSFNEVPDESAQEVPQEATIVRSLSSPRNHVSRKDLKKTASLDKMDSPNGGQKISPDSKEETTAAEAKKKRSILKAIVISMFVTFALVLLLAIFVLESELDIPGVKDIRQLREIQDFKNQHYDPMKLTVSQKLGLKR